MGLQYKLYIIVEDIDETGIEKSLNIHLPVMEDTFTSFMEKYFLPQERDVQLA